MNMLLNNPKYLVMGALGALIIVRIGVYLIKKENSEVAKVEQEDEDDRSV